MNYQVRTAGMEDLPRIEEIYSYARDFMEKTGNPNQWGKTSPPTSQLIKDIEAGNLNVVTDEGVIHGVFFFWIGEDPTYSVIYDGEWISNKPYGTIHRIAGDGSGEIMQTAVQFAKSKIAHLRIDTHEDNRIMQRAIQKAGFSRCGIIYIADGTPRIAYEQI